MKIEEIEKLIKKAEKSTTADDALKFSQAACNVASAYQIATYVNKETKGKK